MKQNKTKLAVLLFAATMSMVMVGCGSKETPVATTDAPKVSTEAETTTEAPKATTEAETSAEVKAETSALEEEGPLALNYEAEPDAYVGKWVLAKAYTAADEMLEVAPEACYLEIETSIDANKLVDEAAYIHADAVNLQGTMSFNHADISVEPYKCSGSWSDWTVVDVVGEGKANFKGAMKFKVRDDDEGVFFDLMTGVAIEDMEMLDVLGMNADGQLILGYSEDHIERDGSAEWEYAYIFEKAAE